VKKRLKVLNITPSKIYAAKQKERKILDALRHELGDHYDGLLESMVIHRLANQNLLDDMYQHVQ
jgi:hypothetical protein